MRAILLFATAILLNSFCFTQNQNISNGAIFDGEPYLVIDPANSQHLVAAWMGFQVAQKVTIKTSYSNNSGLTWSTPIWQAHEVAGNSSADVSLGYDLNGNLYMAYIDHDNVNFLNGAVYVRKSTNGGISWGNAVEVISLLDCPNKACIDRPWMVVDKSGTATDGFIYITTVNADQPTLVIPPYNPYLTKSTDFGITFQNPRYVDTLNYYAGSSITQPMASPTVSSDGSLYALYPSYEPISQGPLAHLFLAKSSDGGTSITHNNAVNITGGSVTNSYVKKGSLLKSDPSNANHLAYFFVAEFNGDADIYYIESLDGGLNWSTQERINQDVIGNGKLQDLVWADFDTDGDLVICWRDKRNGAGTTYQESSEIYGRVRWKDSLNFSNEITISDALVPHDVVLDGSGNDFMNVNFLNDTIYAVWGDVRTGVLSIYLNKIKAQTGTNSLSIIHKEPLGNSVYPNPSKDKLFLTYFVNTISYSILNAEGKEIQNGTHFPENGLEIESLEAGNYKLILNSPETQEVISFIKK